MRFDFKVIVKQNSNWDGVNPFFQKEIILFINDDSFNSFELDSFLSISLNLHEIISDFFKSNFLFVEDKEIRKIVLYLLDNQDSFISFYLA